MRGWLASFLLAPFLLALTALFAVPAGAEPQFPPLAGRVTDAANIIPPDVEARLDQRLAALEAQSTRQVVVATVPSLGGYEISDYGYQLGRAWGIGQKGGVDAKPGAEGNNGAILIIAPTERKVRIEVGYGLEPILTDGFSSDVINLAILPRFKAGDMPGGIEAGVEAIATQITLPPEEAARIAAQANRPPEADIPIETIIFFAFVFFFFILPLLRSMFGKKGGKRYRGGGGPIVWIPGGFSSGGSSGSSWGSGGGGFGGGFSGGGGSFGGGGASGSW